MITIYVKKPTGDLLELEVDPTTVTLFDVKKQICDAEHEEHGELTWKPSMISLFPVQLAVAEDDVNGQPRWDPRITPLTAGDVIGVVCHVQRREHVWLVMQMHYVEGEEPDIKPESTHVFNRMYDALVYLMERMEEFNVANGSALEEPFEYTPKEIFQRASTSMEFTAWFTSGEWETIRLNRVPFSIVQ